MKARNETAFWFAASLAIILSMCLAVLVILFLLIVGSDINDQPLVNKGSVVFGAAAIIIALAWFVAKAVLGHIAAAWAIKKATKKFRRSKTDKEFFKDTQDWINDDEK